MIRPLLTLAAVLLLLAVPAYWLARDWGWASLLLSVFVLFLLADIYRFDNSTFVRTLESRGFVVPDESRANYPKTALSVASALNMGCITSFAPDLQGQPFWWLMSPLWSIKIGGQIIPICRMAKMNARLMEGAHLP